MSRRLSVALLLGLAASASAARLHFDESMTGSMRFVGAPQGAAAQVTLRLRLATDDTDAFFADPTHPMAITGWLDVQPAEGSATSYPVDDGALPGSDEDERVMIYSLRVTSASGRSFWFEGVKTLRDDDGNDAIGDTTRLFSTLRRGAADGPVVASGELRFRWKDPVNMARFLGSFRVRGAGLWGKIKVLKRFMRLYLGTLAKLYL
jgi:hypothetical protein